MGLSESTRYREPSLTVGRNKGYASGLGSTAKLLLYQKILVWSYLFSFLVDLGQDLKTRENFYLTKFRSYVYL